MGNNNRVNRIKNFLLFAPYIFIVILVIICVMLIGTVVRQGNRLSDIEQEISNSNSQNSSITERLDRFDDTALQLTTSVNNMSHHVDILDESVKDILDANSSSANNMWPQKVYLTFDDGPSANTEKILDILDHYGVKGNFFVVGTQSEKLKKYYKRIVDEGHVIGMHSYSHKYSEIYVSKESFIADLDKISDLIYTETGVQPMIYRFPGGSSNSVSRVKMSELIDVLNDRGIRYFDWNILSGDATNPMLPTEDIIENSLKDINQYREAMILFHDLSNKTSTVEALPQVIEKLLEQGITIAPIDDTTMLIQHNTNL